MMTDSGPSCTLETMKGHRKAPWIAHGSERRFLEKTTHGMQKDNERELRAGSLSNVKRGTRARLQAEHPDASSAEIEAIIARRLDHGMKPYRPASNLAQGAPEENLVSAIDRAREQRRNARRRRPEKR